MVPAVFPVKAEVKLSLHSGWYWYWSILGFKYKIPDMKKSYKYEYLLLISDYVFNLYWHLEAFIALWWNK